MRADRLPLGIFTTDERLHVRTWDGWLERSTGIATADAVDRPLADVLPEIRERGLLTVLESVLARGTSQVLAPALHHYLFACPPSAPSSVFDHMQQHVSIGPLKDDGRIVGIMVTIEDVTERMERERELTGELRDEIGTLTRRLADDDWRARREAIAALAQHGQAIVDTLVQTLRERHDNFSVLSSALDLLAVSEIDVIEPLVGFLDDDDVNLRIQAALILGDRRDRRGIPALVAALDDPDSNVRFHAIEALGRIRAVEAADRIAAIAEQRDFFLAFPAIQALTQIGDPAMASRLVPLLADPLLRAPTIDALGALGDEDTAIPLVDLLNRSAAPADVVADALCTLFDRYERRYRAGEQIASLVRRNIHAAGTQAILDAVEHAGPERLKGLAKVLGWLDGEAVQRALTRLLGRQTVRSQVVEALVRHGAGVVPLLAEQLRAEDLDTRQAAAVALGRIGDRRAAHALIDALDDREVAIAAAGALAKIGDPAAFEPMLALLRDRDSAIRQAAIAALNSIGHPEMPGQIAKLLEDPDPLVRESALKVAGYFGYAECVDRVLALCRDDVEAVRRAAVEHLAFFDDPRTAGAIEDALAGDTAPVRAAAVSALARDASGSRLGLIVRALDDDDPWVRYLAVRALGASDAAGAVPAVIDRLQNDAAAPVRLAAIEAVGRLQPAGSLEVLEPLAHANDADTARAAIRALGYASDGTLPLIEQFLRAPDAWRRLAAVEALTLRPETRAADLLQWAAAVDEDAAVVAAAIDALGRTAVREDAYGLHATRALVALTAEPARREAAIAALSGLPARRVPDIAAGLKDPSCDVRCATVEALGRMKQPAASSALEAALDDPDPCVRLAAVTELRHLGARASDRKLMSLARLDSDADVRKAAMMAITRSDLLKLPEPE